MILDLAACEWMKLVIVTEPATTSTAWEASIDDGTAWTPAQAVDDASGWLVAGPNYDGDSVPEFTIPSGTTRVKVRLIDDPETVIRYAERITCKNL